MKSIKKEIKITRKTKKGKVFRILSGKNLEAIQDFMRYYYLKQGWKIIDFKKTIFKNYKFTLLYNERIL